MPVDDDLVLMGLASLNRPASSATPPSGLTRVRLSDVEARSIVWLDKPFLQRGAFHLLAGKKGSAKGTYLCGLAARITRGELYDGPRNVILISSEDSVAVDIKPRVVAAGGDPTRILVVTSDFRLPRDIPALKQLAVEFGDVGLIGIDPLGNHLLSTDTDGEGTVRNAIAGLNGLADELGCIVKGVRHLSKDVSKGALASVLGSTAWGDVPRVVIVMAADDEDDMIFHAQVVAGNRGPRGAAGRQFRLDLVDVGLLEPVTRLRAEGESTKDVTVLLNAYDHEPTSRSAQARDLILDVLDDTGEVESDTLDARVAAATGLAASTVRNIRSKLKDEGLIRSRAERKDTGEVTRWHVSRTAAPRHDVTWGSQVTTSKTAARETRWINQSRPRCLRRESRYLVTLIAP